MMPVQLVQGYVLSNKMLDYLKNLYNHLPGVQKCEDW